MLACCRIRILFVAIIYIALVRLTASSDEAKLNSSCPLWYRYNKRSGHCECCTNYTGSRVDGCHKTNLEIVHSQCMTWNNATQDVEVGRCLFIYKRHMCSYSGYHKLLYNIPTNVSGPELNRFMCSGYNREGAQCRRCIEGYGPALFSDGVTCTDCSKHRYHWILYFIFQLTMVTIMYLAVVLLRSMELLAHSMLSLRTVK
jgi:hypothetical protein